MRQTVSGTALEAGAAEFAANMPRLEEKAAALVQRAKQAGADSADVMIVAARRFSAAVRLGKTEEAEASESDDFSLRVFVGGRAASVSAALTADLDGLAARAVAMAKVSPQNPFAGEAPQALLAKNFRALDLWDSYAPNMETLRADALALEEAALAVKGVSNSGGARASYGFGGVALATSGGFCGSYLSSSFGRSVSALARDENGALERDYDFSAARHYEDMDSPAAIGGRAGQQAAARLHARQAPTGKVNVLFAPRAARSLAGHLSAMVNGDAVARKTALLQNRMNKRIMPKGIDVTDNPLRPRGPASRPFDGEGVAPQPLAIVEDGVLRAWLLSCSAARELGLETNGRGARAGNDIVPQASNFAIEPGSESPEALLRQMQTGFYATELFGRGADLITGQYSRGASGFWVENGALAYPVSEITLASDLMHIFAHMTAADDIDRRYAVTAPSLLAEGMTLAGK